MPNFYVVVAGNTYSAIDVVHKLDAATRAVVSSGDTNNLSAVNSFGTLSRDATALYLSYSTSLSYRTGVMDEDTPFNVGTLQANTNWIYTSIFNPYSGVRAYAGHSKTVDLRGAVNLAVDLSAYITGAVLGACRMLYRTGTNHIFVANCAANGVVRINTVTGAVDAVAGVGAYFRAMYYSADSDTLYVESSAVVGDPGTVTAYNADTLAAGATFASAGVAAGGLIGHTIHLGGEVFVGSESTSAPSGRVWLADLSAGPGSVSVFGSGTHIARDPDTGYIWTPWNSGGGSVTPDGGSTPRSGTYVLVYDPATETLIDEISLGASGSDRMGILFSGDGNGDGGVDGGGDGTHGGGGAGAAVVLPALLPGPSVIRIAAVDHRAKPADTNGPYETRALQLDRLYDEYCEFVFSLAECEAFVTWWTDTLIEGGLRFTSGWQTPQGTALSRQFIGAPRFMGHDSQGGWRMACNFQVFGRMEPPRNYGAAPAPAPAPAPPPAPLP